MSKNDKQYALVPRLRFPEFRENGPWDSTLLGDFATILKGKGISKADLAPNGALPCIRYAELYTRYGEVIHDVASRTNLMADELFLSKEQDVIIPASGETKIDIATASCVMPKGVALGSDLNVIRSGLYGPFFSYYLNGTKRHDIAKVAQGDTIAHLYPGQLEKVEISYPTPEEQQKIAECLGSLDDLIAAEGRKQAALRDHKKGLMQQLFPREGETRPRLRFPEFRGAPEWEENSLGEIATISKGKGISKSDVIDNGETPCVRYGELYTIYGEVIDHVKSSTNLPVSDLVLSRAGDVIIPASGETKEDIATCACVVDEGVALSSDLNVIHSPIDGRFLSYYLNGSRRRQLAKVAQGDTVAHLYPMQLSQLQIRIPVEKNEQHHIADCLTSIDTMITAQAEKLDALRTHKRGLMQQLFPSTDGFTS